MFQSHRQKLGNLAMNLGGNLIWEEIFGWEIGNSETVLTKIIPLRSQYYMFGMLGGNFCIVRIGYNCLRLNTMKYFIQGNTLIFYL